MKTQLNGHFQLHADPSNVHEGTALVSLFGNNMTAFIHGVPSAQLMECAEGMAKVAAQIDPDGFDALWERMKESLRAARTRPVDLPTDLTCDKVNQQEEEYINNNQTR